MVGILDRHRAAIMTLTIPVADVSRMTNSVDFAFQGVTTPAIV
jgi:hypothetical protein